MYVGDGKCAKSVALYLDIREPVVLKKSRSKRSILKKSVEDDLSHTQFVLNIGEMTLVTDYIPIGMFTGFSWCIKV